MDSMEQAIAAVARVVLRQLESRTFDAHRRHIESLVTHLFCHELLSRSPELRRRLWTDFRPWPEESSESIDIWIDGDDSTEAVAVEIDVGDPASEEESEGMRRPQRAGGLLGELELVQLERGEQDDEHAEGDLERDVPAHAEQEHADGHTETGLRDDPLQKELPVDAVPVSHHDVGALQQVHGDDGRQHVFDGEQQGRQGERARIICRDSVSTDNVRVAGEIDKTTGKLAVRTTETNNSHFWVYWSFDM